MNLATSNPLSTLVKLTFLTLIYDFPVNALIVESSHAASDANKVSNGLLIDHFSAEV
jgi:hypothetical protein